MVDTSKYSDGIIYQEAGEIYPSTEPYGAYYVTILTSDLISQWQEGCLYKIQLRFGTTPTYKSSQPEDWDTSKDGTYNFVNWKNKQIDKGTFSEWSTVW